jgi:xylulokinase
MLPKLLWLRRHAPEAFARARYFVNTKDAIYGFLTGRHGRTDFSDASLTGALNIHTGQWDAQLLRDLGLNPDAMPEILPSHDVSGRLTAEAARALGLPVGTPVAIGAGDGVCATHGAGLFRPGSAYINMGSSAWLATLSDAPVIDPERRVFNFLDMDGRRAVICATVQCAGAAYDWALENLLLPGQKPGAAAYAAMEALAAGAPPGADGLFFLPTLMGERTPWWDAQARGTLIGATLYHDRRHIARAVYEGVAQALHLCDSAARACGLAYDALALIGGGAGSGLWPQMLADQFDLPTRVHAQPREATSLGAAMAAGVGVGLFADYAQAAQMARFAPALAPDSARAGAYAAHYAVYRALYGQVAGAYRLVAGYQAGDA